MAITAFIVNLKLVGLIIVVLSLVLKIAEGAERCHLVDSVAVTSPNFPNNYPLDYKCTSKFETFPGCKVKLSFQDFALESSVDCKYDYVALYDGDKETDPLLGKFCGKDKPPTITSTAHRMLLVFSSDAGVVAKGFKVSQSTECFQRLSMTPYEEGVLTSPNYPNNYPNNLNATWMFEINPDDKFTLAFDDFRLRLSFNCTFDYVAIYNGSTEEHPLLGKFCGGLRPSPIKSTAQKLLVVFKSDNTLNSKGFKLKYAAELNMEKIVSSETERVLVQYFLNKQHCEFAVNKWGTDITRTAVALFLHNPKFFTSGNETGEEIAYELAIQLLSKLVTSKLISTTDLALFVNALTVACINPTNIFGINLVSELRKRTDDGSYTNPFLMLALCNGGENMKAGDVEKLHQLFYANLQPSWTGTQAVIVMALKCIAKQTNMNLDVIINKMVLQLKTKKLQTNGTIDNLKNTALVVQALIATKSYRTDFNFSGVLKSIFNNLKRTDLSFKEMYYILPILKWRTLLNISSDHCNDMIETDLENFQKTRKAVDEFIRLKISIVIGDNLDFLRTWEIPVPSHYSLYQALENITSQEFNYKVRYVISDDGKPYVDGLDSFQNSIEDGKFWFIYTRTLLSDENATLIEKSPVDIYVNETNNLILWYKSLSWSSNPEFTILTTNSEPYTLETTTTNTVK